MSDYNMDLADFIKTAIKSAEKNNHSISANIFDYNYQPKKIFLREEVEDIIKIIIDFDKIGTNQNIFYYGARGSGKTVTMKHIKKIIAEQGLKTPIFYINCRLEGTPFRVLSSLLNERVVGLGFNDIMKKIDARYKKLILILDEIDLITTRERSKDLLYLLSRSEGTKYQLFLLSNNINFYGKIDEATKSTLQLRKIHFKNYDAVEILKILDLRLSEAKTKKIPKKFVSELSARTASEANSDMRVALKCLELSHNYGDYGNLENYFNKAREDIFLDMIQYFNDQLLLTLKAINSTKTKIMRDIYSTYINIAKIKHDKVLTYPTFLNNMSYLQSVGAILLINQKVNRGWSNRVEVLCRPELINYIFKERKGV